jgi:hypothetical protein
MEKVRPPNLLSTSPGGRVTRWKQVVLKMNDLLCIFPNDGLEDMLACIGIVYERISLGAMNELKVLSSRLSEYRL